MTTATKPADAIAAAKARLGKIDAQLGHAEAQLAATRADADAAYGAKDTATLQKLFDRQAALERQRQDYAADAERLADELRAACSPLLNAIAQEARQTVAAYQRDQDAAIAVLGEHAAGCVQAVESLRALPTWTQWGALLGDWKQRYQAALDDAGVTLALPDVPEPLALPIVEIGRALDALRPLTQPRGALLPDRVWR